MTLRNRVLALAGAYKLGDRFAPVVKMLPEARQAAVEADLHGFAGAPPEKLGERLDALRVKEARRRDRVGRARYGAGWNRLDPRVREWLVRHGRNENH